MASFCLMSHNEWNWGKRGIRQDPSTCSIKCPAGLYSASCLCEMPSLAEASQALKTPAPNDVVAQGHKAPAQGDKGFNFLAKTDDSFDKNRQGWWELCSNLCSSLSPVLSSMSTCLGNLCPVFCVFFPPTTPLPVLMSLLFFLFVLSSSYTVWGWSRQVRLSSLLFIFIPYL